MTTDKLGKRLHNLMWVSFWASFIASALELTRGGQWMAGVELAFEAMTLTVFIVRGNWIRAVIWTMFVLITLSHLPH